MPVMRVLVFDDVLYTRQQDYAGLGIGMDLHFYAHADDAVDVVQLQLPDLVLMDYAMDEHRTGEEAIQALRRKWPRGKLTIVGISSDAYSNERMLASGADDAVPKSHLRGYLRGMKLRKGGAAGGSQGGSGGEH